MIFSDLLQIVLIDVGVVLIIGYLWLRKKNASSGKEIDKFVDGALELYKQSMIPLKIEQQDNGAFYCYNNNNDEFVCQGSNIKEIKFNFKERFPQYGSYILHDYLHYFPDIEVEPDPTDEEIKANLLKDLNEKNK